MASIDERVVAMSFENTTFESKVAVTMATLTKLDTSIRNIGSVSGLDKIEAQANKVTLTAPMTALDKLKAKLGLAGQGASESLGEIDRAGNKVGLLGPMTAIDKLKSHLGTVGTGAAEGFNEIEKASGKVGLLPLHSAVDSITAKFSAMTVAFSAALGTMVTTATLKGKDIVNSLTLGPITGGLEEYATNLNSIQTILANTQASGADLQDVNRALQELNEYSDQTIYNFSQMAKNIGTFTAAGVDLETATGSIKGIANLAALSGSNSEQASTAMYQLSQAISSGRVSLQDWNSVVNAGMGGTVFQRALANTAQNMGTLGDGAVDLKGKMKNVTIEGQSFRESIQAKPGEKSWLTSDVLTKTLQQFTGDLTDAELRAQGFNDAQIKAIQQTAQTAKKAATEVKTLKGVFDVAKESMGSGWAATFQVIFGNFEEAKKTFTELSGAIQGMIGDSAEARNKVLEDWKELGGRTVLIDGIKKAFEALMSVLTPIKEAFRDIFPRQTGQDLYDLTVRFRDFMESLKIGPETAENLKRSFRGLFALLSIGKTIVGGIIGVIFDLLGVVGEGSGGFLAFTGSIGDFLVALDIAISKGEGLEGVFEGLSAVLQTPLELLKAISSSITELFGGADPKTGEELASALGRMEKELGPFGVALEAVVKVWEKFFEVMGDVSDFLMPILEDIKDVFSQIGDAVVEGLEGVDYDKVMTAIQTVFLGGLAVGVKKLLGGIGVDLTGGLVKNFKTVTDTLSSTLVSIQKNVNAQTMLLIAAAVVALAGATLIFSQIDAKQLGKAMTAISVGIGQLVGAMALLTKVGGKGAFLTLPFIALGMLVLAGALIVLGGAMKIFATMSWEELGKGLLGVAGGLTAIGAATKLMGPNIILIGPGLLIVAAALTVLAVAMKIFGSMDWEEIGKGLVGIGGALVIIGAAVKGIGPGMLIIGPGLILVSAGLILLSGAVSSFGNMDLGTMAKGLLGIAASLVVIGVAIMAIPPTVALQAAGLLILGIALTGIATAVGVMGSLGIGTIAKGLIAIAAALVIFAVGLTAMSGTLPGSVALLAAAAAFAILTPALVVLGSLEWSTIIKGLAAIALTLGVLAIVGALASGPLTALGVALLVIGGSVLLVSAGFYLLAKAFALLGEEGTKGVGVMVAAITAFIALIPKMVIDFVKGLVDILASLVKLAPQIAESLVKIISTWFTALEKLIPQAAELIGKLLAFIVLTIDEHAGPLIDAGFRMLLNFLSGIENNIGQVVTKVAGIITKFLDAMTANAPELAKSGANFLAAWLKGIADNIEKVANQAANVIIKFLNSIADKLPEVYATGVKVIVKFLRSIADAIPRYIAAGTRIILAFMDGVEEAIPKIIKKGLHVARKFLNALADGLAELADIGFNAIIRFLNGLERAIRKNDDELFAAGAGVADAIVDGLVEQFGKLGGVLRRALEEVFDLLPGWAKKILGIDSPSKVFMEIGRQTMLGFMKGIEDSGSSVKSTMGDAADNIVKSASDTMGKIPNLLEGMLDLDPVITPVLDLSNVEKGAKQIGDLATVVPITAAASYGQAAAISEEQQVVQRAQAAEAAVTQFNFEQNNYSPEKLSEIEIYRQTNNQLAQAKSALGMT